MITVHIGFSTPIQFKIGAELIKLWEHCDFSHTYIRFESDTIPSSVYHAAHGMVHFMSYDRFKEHNIPMYEYEVVVTPEQRREILIQCVQLAGIEYSQLELVNIFLTDLCASLGYKLKTENPKGYICSELVGEFLISLGVRFDKETHLLTPPDIKRGLIKWQESLLYQT